MADSDLRVYYIQNGSRVYLIGAYSKADALQQVQRGAFADDSQAFTAYDVKPFGGRCVIQFNGNKKD